MLRTDEQSSQLQAAVAKDLGEGEWRSEDAVTVVEPVLTDPDCPDSPSPAVCPHPDYPGDFQDGKTCGGSVAEEPAAPDPSRSTSGDSGECSVSVRSPENDLSGSGPSVTRQCAESERRLGRRTCRGQLGRSWGRCEVWNIRKRSNCIFFGY